MDEKTRLIKIQLDVSKLKTQLENYIDRTKDYGFTEDAVSNLEDAVKNINKQLASNE